MDGCVLRSLSFLVREMLLKHSAPDWRWSPLEWAQVCCQVPCGWHCVAGWHSAVRPGNFPDKIMCYRLLCRREQADCFKKSTGEITVFCRPAFAFREANRRHLSDDFLHVSNFVQRKILENFNWIPLTHGMMARKGSDKGCLTGVQKHTAHRPFSHSCSLWRCRVQQN